MDKLENPNGWKFILAFLAIYLGWGSTYLVIAMALQDFSPFILAGFRFFVAGGIFLLWCLWKKTDIPNMRVILHQSIIGILLLFFGSGSVIWVEQFLSSGLTSIIWASLPIWLILLDRKQWRKNFSDPILILGLLVGFAGVTSLFWDMELLSPSSPSIIAALIIAIGGVICFSFGSLFSKYSQTKGDLILSAGIQLLVAGAMALIFGFSLMGEKLPNSSSNTFAVSMGSLIYLIIVGSLISYSAYVWLIQFKPPAIVGTYTYVNPVVALLLGWSFLGEKLTFLKICALVLISVGVLIINFNKSKTHENDSKNVARQGAKG